LFFTHPVLQFRHEFTMLGGGEADLFGSGRGGFVGKGKRRDENDRECGGGDDSGDSARGDFVRPPRRCLKRGRGGDIRVKFHPALSAEPSTRFKPLTAVGTEHTLSYGVKEK
jgi:hypothetical protein